VAKKHIMIDLETMGLEPNAAIISIGAVHFDKTTLYSEFYTPVSLKSCMDLGLTTTQSTVDWWQKQSVEARMAWQIEDAPGLMESLTQFNGWLRGIGSEKEICPWGNGADFDLTILGSAHRALQVDPPWEFYNHHCFRTMKNMFRVANFPRQGTHHNALDDAKHQVLHLQRILDVHRIELP
jgi:3' exoribonuclease, RNase T-like